MFGKKCLHFTFFLKDILLDIEFLFGSSFSITINLNIGFHVPFLLAFMRSVKKLVLSFIITL